MKKLIILFLSIILMINFVSCGKIGLNSEINEPVSAYDSVIKEATDVLKDEWKNQYEEHCGDGYFEIKNTRIIVIKDNENKYFDNIKYIIEFVLFTDYYGTSPYYSEAHFLNSVIYYESGEVKPINNYLRLYSSKTFDYDYSKIIESIVDYGSKYNVKETLK